MPEATEDTLAGAPLSIAPSSTGSGPPSVDATMPSGLYPSADRRTKIVEPGTIVGRYVVIAKLGAGAMGVVLAAYDPELDRKVALKLIKFEGADPGEARARLKREAQALAKLAHPNVVAVHDVGEHQGQLFVAMEFVEGETLGAWMRASEGPRDWREVVRVFADAGRGLAAAHGVSLVHRDFKPDNVMIGRDGRVRVMDFGLARANLEAGAELRQRAPTELPTALLLDSRMTHTGALLGTPAYMAYELFGGAPADALSDQFSFCATLYQALYGARPFRGENVGALVLALEIGEIPEPPKGTTVPSWLRRVVVHGLAHEPGQRYPSMQALLAELTADPSLRRRRWLGAAIVIAGLVGATWGIRTALQPPAPVDHCSGSEAELAGVWDSDRRARVETSLLDTGLPHAAQTFERVAARLDQYTGAWVEQRTAACEATQRGEQSDAMLDAQVACLDDRLGHVHATVDVLEQADATVLNKAADAVTSLPSLASCDDLDALLAAVPPPEDPQLAAAITALDGRLTRARVLREHGKVKDGLAEAEAIVAADGVEDYPPFEARARLVLGNLQHDDGDYEGSEQTYLRAYELALAHNMIDEAAEASAQLVFVVGNRLARVDEGHRWIIDARPLAQAAGTAEAEALFEVNHGALLLSEAHYDEAREALERAVDAWTRAYGPDHARVGASLSNLGVVAARKGERAKAREYYERALAIREAALGPDHPGLAAPLTNLGSLVRSEGDYETARRLLLRSLEVGASLGEDNPVQGFGLNNLGTLALEQDKPDEARDYFEQARVVWEKAHGLAHPHTLTAAMNLGDVAVEQGRYEAARTIYTELIPTAEQVFGLEHPLLAHPLNGLGIAELRLGRPAESVALLERALALPGVVDGDAELLAELRFNLALALWDAKIDRGRARELAELARATDADAGAAEAERLAKIDAWLESHG